MSQSLSVIIPTLNEIEAIPPNLSNILSHESVSECILVDGGSIDGTVEYISKVSDSRVQLLQTDTGRGGQLNLGAQIANGDWLLFHHADSFLPGDAITTLTAITDRTVQWGGFLHQFTNTNWKLRIISAMHNMRCRLSGVVYGDQSMFVRPELFNVIGGFSVNGLEDLIFSDLALQKCRPTILQYYVQTDPRKFKEMGEFRALAHVIGIVLNYQRNRPIGHDQFFEPYR